MSKIERRKVLALLAAVPAAAVAQKSNAQVKRRPVVPMAMIQRFRMQPSEYGFYVLGEDGRPYLLDDVLAAIVQIIWR